MPKKKLSSLEQHRFNQRTHVRFIETNPQFRNDVQIIRILQGIIFTQKQLRDLAYQPDYSKRQKAKIDKLLFRDEILTGLVPRTTGNTFKKWAKSLSPKEVKLLSPLAQFLVKHARENKKLAEISLTAEDKQWPKRAYTLIHELMELWKIPPSWRSRVIDHVLLGTGLAGDAVPGYEISLDYSNLDKGGYRRVLIETFPDTHPHALREAFGEAKKLQHNGMFVAGEKPKRFRYISSPKLRDMKGLARKITALETTPKREGDTDKSHAYSQYEAIFGTSRMSLKQKELDRLRKTKNRIRKRTSKLAT